MHAIRIRPRWRSRSAVAVVGLVLLGAVAIQPGIRRSTGAAAQAGSAPARVSVQDALLRPYRFPFAEDTALQEVANALKQTLGAPVVLDLAALKRLEITPETPVRLDLDGVRLKTGLQILLDQVEMTFKVVPEDNLLILTDREGSENPIDRVLAEIKAMHREIHDLQDAVLELTEGAMPDEGPFLRKPTIIEDLPPEKGQEPGQAKPRDMPADRVRSGY